MKRLLIAAMLAAGFLMSAAGDAKAYDTDSWLCRLFGHYPPGPPVYFVIQVKPGSDYWPMVPIVDPGQPLR